MATTKTAVTGKDMTAEVVFLTRALKAPTLRESVSRLAERARAESWSHEEFLVACLQREVSARESHGGEGRIRVVRLLHLPQRDGDTLHEALKTRMGGLPAALLRSITWDQGTEMARHLTITESLRAPVYFCDSRSPWQRGSNENMNGLLRDYFPKGTDLSIHSPAHLLAVEDELNKRPRLVLHDRAPAELFGALLASNNPSVLRR